MFYVIKSDTKSIRDKIINNLIGSKGISQEDIHIFDFEEKNDYEKAFFEYLSINFDSNPKAVIIKNSDFLNKAKVEKEIEDRFANTINLNTPNFLIMTVDKLNKTGKLNKKFNDKFELLEKDAPTKNELNNFIEKYFSSREILINKDTIEKIISRVGENFDILITELNKLDILQQDNQITNELVDKTVIDFSRERLYKVSEYVITLDETRLIELMKQLRSEGEGPYLIGEFLVKEFSKLLRYMAIKAKHNHISDGEIQKMTGWNIWAIKNYSKWSHIWPSLSVLSKFYYNVILDKTFLQTVLYSPEDPLNVIEKTLVANILLIKGQK